MRFKGWPGANAARRMDAHHLFRIVATTLSSWIANRMVSGRFSHDQRECFAGRRLRVALRSSIDIS